MKILLTAINARYVHTNLALRYLAASLDTSSHEVLIQEYTINQYPQEIRSQLFETMPDIVGFSCYIWNIEMVLKIVASLKKVSPETVIILGGPEVSYDPEQVMKQNDSIDFIISGEGEAVFTKLIECLDQNDDYTLLPSLSYRIRGEVYTNASVETLQPMDKVPSPYKRGQTLDPGRIYYYESTRGCPFHCQFCLSGNRQGTAMLPLDRVYEDLAVLIGQKVSQVKFVDRTFNAYPDRALAIWQFLLLNDNGVTNFHFEMNASLLNEGTVEFLEKVPNGLFQFEIGVQSTNESALRAIKRNPDQKKTFQTIKALALFKNIHLHVDLIAGLPHEDYFSFRESFNEVFLLGADMVQLGFLKLLKGSGLRKDSQKYRYVFQDDPPYEILETQWVSYNEILLLKHVEAALERYWNSGKYRNTIEAAMTLSQSEPFYFFEGLSREWQRMVPPMQNTGEKEQLKVLTAYLDSLMPEKKMLMRDLLRFDYCSSDRMKQLPDTLRIQTTSRMNDTLHDLLHDNEFNQEFFPDMEELPAKKKLPYVRILPVNGNLVLQGTDRLICPASCDEKAQEQWLLFIYPRERNAHRSKTIVIQVEEA